MSPGSISDGPSSGQCCCIINVRLISLDQIWGVCFHPFDLPVLVVSLAVAPPLPCPLCAVLAVAVPALPFFLFLFPAATSGACCRFHFICGHVAIQFCSFYICFQVSWQVCEATYISSAFHAKHMWWATEESGVLPSDLDWGAFKLSKIFGVSASGRLNVTPAVWWVWFGEHYQNCLPFAGSLSYCFSLPLLLSFLVWSDGRGWCPMDPILVINLVSSVNYNKATCYPTSSLFVPLGFHQNWMLLLGILLVPSPTCAPWRRGRVGGNFELVWPLPGHIPF